MSNAAIYISILAGGLVAIVLGLALVGAANWRSRVMRSHGEALLIPGIVLGLIGALVVFGLLANGIGFFLWLILLVIVAMAITRRRVGQRHALLRLLASATEARAPLLPAVAAFASENPGPVGADAHRLRHLLDSGELLPYALTAVRSLAPRRERALLHLGVQLDNLSPALAEAADNQEPDSITGEIAAHLLYIFWILVFGVSVLTFVMLKIVPAFKQIFEDFGTELPAITQVVITLSVIAAEFWPLLALGLVMLWGVFIYCILVYIGWVRWRIPLPIFWTRGLETATVLRGLAVAVEARSPLEKAVSVLMVQYPDAWIRRQLAKMGQDISAGIPWWESLWLRQLVTSADRSLLQAAARLGNVAWALRTVADQHRWKLSYQLRWWLHALSPPLLLIVGALVAFVVVGLFMPLIKIVETLT